MPHTIAIADIHGCSDALASILQAIDPQPNDNLIALGDYVNRAVDSKGVLNLLIKLLDLAEPAARTRKLEHDEPVLTEEWGAVGGGGGEVELLRCFEPPKCFSSQLSSPRSWRSFQES